MTAVKPRESFVQRAADASHGKWYSSFRFDISHMPIELFSDSDPALCPYIPSPTLPPSFDTETVDFEALNFETYDQGGCQVAYTLHARCLLGNVCVAEISREIDVVPRAQPLPPLDTSDYPGEYRLKGSKALRKRFVQKQIGQLSVTTMEPAPLQIDQSKDTTSTKINLEFRFHQASAGSLAGPPEFSHCVVFSRLRSCTFVSTLQRSSMPTQQQLDNVPSLLRIVRHKPIQTRESHFPRWRGVLQDESHHCRGPAACPSSSWLTFSRCKFLGFADQMLGDRRIRDNSLHHQYHSITHICVLASKSKIQLGIEDQPQRTQKYDFQFGDPYPGGSSKILPGRL